MPNPFFDLIGIACGHFDIAFKKFLLATVIGKSFIKANIQALSIIFTTFYLTNDHFKTQKNSVKANHFNFRYMQLGLKCFQTLFIVFYVYSLLKELARVYQTRLKNSQTKQN